MYTVFIVDDDPAIREIFTAFLRKEGFSAIPVMGGSECLDLLKTRSPDLILLDLMMEPMDGWETLTAIRKDPTAAEVPVIVITGKQPVPEDILRYGNQIEGFIVKPIEFDRLVSRLPGTLEKIGSLRHFIARKMDTGADPALTAEYTCLRRTVRLTRDLMRRYPDLPWADRMSLGTQEARLATLHTLLGCPGRVPERDRPGTGFSVEQIPGRKQELLSGSSEEGYHRR